MDLRQLSALIAIADQGSFSGAAAALGTVQSNVSTHIKRLERELGLELVDRHGAQCTEAGQGVVERARRIQAELDAIVSDIASLQDEVVGSVRVGMIGTTARWLVPLLLDSLTRNYPKVRLVTVEGTSAGLIPQLIVGTIDTAIINMPVTAPEIAARALFDEDMVLVISKDHPLADLESLSLEDLDGLELLMPAPGTALREELDTAAHRSGITLRPIADIDGLRLLTSLAVRGYGPALVPATGASDIPDGYKTTSVQGLPYRTVCLATRRRGRPSAPTRALLELLDDVVATDVEAQQHLHSRNTTIIERPE